jgi:hypothetical protein
MQSIEYTDFVKIFPDIPRCKDIRHNYHGKIFSPKPPLSTIRSHSERRIAMGFHTRSKTETHRHTIYRGRETTLPEPLNSFEKGFKAVRIYDKKTHNSATGKNFQDAMDRLRSKNISG